MKQHLESREQNRDEMINLVNGNIEKFNEAIEIMLAEEEPNAWRSAWVVKQSMELNDIRVIPYVSKLIESLRTGSEGYCRETLNILNKMSWNDDQEGKLFDVSISIWENIHLKPGVRSKAIYTLFKIAKRYPELNSELKLITEEYYLESISPGIRKGIVKLINLRL